MLLKSSEISSSASEAEDNVRNGMRFMIGIEKVKESL
jgi:hypothetical protein